MNHKITDMYERPRAHVGMTTVLSPDGSRKRTSIAVFVSRWAGNFSPFHFDTLVETANFISDGLQLYKLPDEVMTFELGIEQLHPMLFDWLKMLIPGAPWDRTAVATIGEPPVPKYSD